MSGTSKKDQKERRKTQASAYSKSGESKNLPQLPNEYKMILRIEHGGLGVKHDTLFTEL